MVKTQTLGPTKTCCPRNSHTWKFEKQFGAIPFIHVYSVREGRDFGDYLVRSRGSERPGNLPIVKHGRTSMTPWAS
jgi:hypothetical protein